MKIQLPVIICIMLLYLSCTDVNRNTNLQSTTLQSDTLIRQDSLFKVENNDSSAMNANVASVSSRSISINNLKISADDIVRFAETLIGTPYKFASADPALGFDCSGFITYVFNHFNIEVPRSSIDFTNAGTNVSLKEASRGDIILFRGTDSTEKFVGHMGIVIFNSDDSLSFIHSSSGKAYGVTLTPLNEYYKGRFIKVIRLFK